MLINYLDDIKMQNSSIEKSQLEDSNLLSPNRHRSKAIRKGLLALQERHEHGKRLFQRVPKSLQDQCKSTSAIRTGPGACFDETELD